LIIHGLLQINVDPKDMISWILQPVPHLAITVPHGGIPPVNIPTPLTLYTDCLRSVTLQPPNASGTRDIKTKESFRREGWDAIMAELKLESLVPIYRLVDPEGTLKHWPKYVTLARVKLGQGKRYAALYQAKCIEFHIQKPPPRFIVNCP
jgi:hypothetical protein